MKIQILTFQSSFNTLTRTHIQAIVNTYFLTLFYIKSIPGKFGLKHSGPEIEALASIAVAAKLRSLEMFQLAVRV